MSNIVPLELPDFTRENIIRYWNFFDKEKKVKPHRIGWWADLIIENRFKFKGVGQFRKAIRSIGEPVSTMDEGGRRRRSSIRAVGADYYETLTETGQRYCEDVPQYLISDCLNFFRAYGALQEGRTYSEHIKYWE